MKPSAQDMPCGKGLKGDGASTDKNSLQKESKTDNKALMQASYDNSGWLSRLLFCWVNPTTTRCLKGAIEPKDLPPLCQADLTEMKSAPLDASLCLEELRSNRPSILKATLREFWPSIATAALWCMVREALSFGNTFLLKEILKDDGMEGYTSWHQGLIAAGTLSAVQLLLVFLDGHLDFYMCRVMVRVETALLTSLYKRMLRGNTMHVPNVSIKKAPPHSAANPRPQQGSAANSTQKNGTGHRGPETNKGAIFNIVFVDIPSIAEMVLTSVDLIILPVRIGLAVTLLIMQIGESCTPGVITLVTVILITVCLEAYNGTLKIPFMKRRDTRLGRSHECLKEMRTLRLLGWEDIAEDIVNKQRAKELKWSSFRMYLSGISYWLTSVAGVTTTVVTFFAYTFPYIQGRAGALNMRPDLVIPIIHMMDNIVGPLADLPYTISTVIEGQISLNRIRSYLFQRQSTPGCDANATSSSVNVSADSELQTSEVEPLLERHRGSAGNEERKQQEETCEKLFEAAQKMFMAINDPALKVRFVNASFSWIPFDEAPFGRPAGSGIRKDFSPVSISSMRASGGSAVLNSITFDLRCGELLLVTGPPGSGKTTLVQAVLQKSNLTLRSGSCYISNGSRLGNGQMAQMVKGEASDSDDGLIAEEPVGYIPQEAWLCGGTVRENIVFGDAFHLPTYNAVVKACELRRDFEAWRHGDLRVIDEGGLDLSGGQRVRVNIARAIYSCKMYQMQMQAVGEQAEAAHRSRQNNISENLVGAVAREAEGSEKYKQFKDATSTSPKNLQKPSFACLLCFDECFNSLDLSVAGHVFHNLFGPNGLLEDCAVLLCLNDSSLMGLVRQHAGQAGFHKHRKGDASGTKTAVVESPSRMAVSICRLSHGTIAWRGGVKEFREVIGAVEPPGVQAAGRNVASIEQLLSVQECDIDDGDSDGPQTQTPTARKIAFSGQLGELRTLAVAEHGASGKVNAASYFWYLNHLGRFLAVVFFLIVTCTSVSDVASDLLLTKWTSLNSEGTGLSGSPLASGHMARIGNTNQENQSVRSSHKQFLWIFVSISGVNMLFEMGEKIAGVAGSMRASKAIHKRLWAGVCNAPMWFYDQNPVGRILNRFSTDIAIIDNGILRRIGYSLTSCVSCILSILVLSVACKWVIPLWPLILVAIYLLIFRYFRSTSREVQRASLLSFSPLCSCFSECLSGREVISALRKERFFLRDMSHHLDLCQRTKQMHWGINSWCNIRLQLMLLPLVVLNSTLPRLLNAGSSSLAGAEAPMKQADIGLIGLAISYSISIAGSLRRLLSNVTIMEKEMCSVERVQSYLTETESQRSDRVGASSRPSTLGQHNGSCGAPLSAVLPLKRTGLQLLRVEVRYRVSAYEEAGGTVTQPKPDRDMALPVSEGLPLPKKYQPEQQSSTPDNEMHNVHDIEASAEGPETNGGPSYSLKASICDFSAHVKVGERIGVVGRTGAGKSTLLQALYGLLPCHSGAIFLDGSRLDCLPRQVVRSVIGTLPQRAVVFEGWTVRDVLDPRHQHTDDILWRALRIVGLDSVVESLPGGAKLNTILLGDASRSNGALEDQQEPSSVQKAPNGDLLSAAGSYHTMSAWQMRYLAFGRLVVDAPKLRVVLIDEPPAEELWDEASSSGVGVSGTASPKCGKPTAEILEEHFKECCVIVVAHHLTSLRGCTRVWVLSDGYKVGECVPSEIDTEQKFNKFLADCTKKPR